MSLFLTSVCVVVSVTSLRAEIGTLTTVLSSNTDDKSPSVKNKNFVDVIKESLRKNNDDYAIDGRLDEEVQVPVKTRRSLNDSEPIALLDNGTVTDVNPATTSVDSTVFRSAAKDFVRKKKHEHHQKHSTHTESTKSTTTSTQTVSQRKEGNLEKWKQLIQKSNRLRKHTSSPKIELTSPTLMSRIQSALRTDTEGATKRTVTRPKLRQAPNLAILPLRSPGPVRKPPNADQLDMAPARGAYIHDLRLKGRFCHRHVLWPEGPKYNSKGETIMPAFNVSLYHGRRRFFETSKPIYVLPRCCNCCKKSVLGCQ